MKMHFFIEDTHLPPKISKCISSHFINRTANEKPRHKIEDFSKCDDFSGEIIQLTDINIKFAFPCFLVFTSPETTETQIGSPNK
jgi:hypothetical protein